MLNKVVLFGEVMLRLTPPGFLRFGQAHSFDVLFGGSEVNVAASLSNYGVPTDFVSRVPDNDIGLACLQCLRQYGIGVEHVLLGGDRLGIYYLEMGAAQRGSKVIYDRVNSSFATLEPSMINWKEVLAGASWFHVTGITPAVSASAAACSLEAVHAAREIGLTVSCDLNYRKKLWKWGKRAGEVMSELVSFCDLAIGNEEDAEQVFGIKAPETDVMAGEVEASKYHYVCEGLSKRFPALKMVAITLRGSISASHNTWSGVLWDQGAYYTAPVFDITHIVDRVGAGDSFVGGLIYGLLKDGSNKQKALNFGVAASCLKHSIYGDFNEVTIGEVEALAKGEASGRVSR
jgi:2-dehydro-3-deoxygluconokinase